MSSGSFIQIDNIAKRFPRSGKPPLAVIDGFSLGIDKGSLVSVLGPSGCGKSTLLNLMNGLDDVSSGSITINGRRVGRRQRSDVRIGVAFQTRVGVENELARRELLFAPLRDPSLKPRRLLLASRSKTFATEPVALLSRLLSAAIRQIDVN